MQAPQRMLTVVAGVLAGGCATGDADEQQYDEVARIIGAGFTTPSGGGELGAFRDSAILARGQLPLGAKVTPSGVVENTYGDVRHRYFVVCDDAAGLAVASCDETTARARVLGSWIGPLATDTHDGTLRRGGYWTIYDPWHEMGTVIGSTWFEYVDGAYRLDDVRSVLLTVNMGYGVVTGGAMHGTITLQDDATLLPDSVDIRAEITLTPQTATLTLDGTHTTVVDISPILIK